MEKTTHPRTRVSRFWLGLLCSLVFLACFFIAQINPPRPAPRPVVPVLNPPRPGQVWHRWYNLKNPFKKPYYCTVNVLAVKNGYVQYTQEGREDTLSTEIEYFTYQAQQVK